MEQRINLLLKKLNSKNNLNMEDTAVIITSKNNRLYFSTLNSSTGIVVITKEESYLLVDFRYYEMALKASGNLKVILVEDFFDSLKEILIKHKIKNILFENEFVSLEKYKKIKNFLKEISVNLIEKNILNPVINDLRSIKTELEIKKMKTAQEISEYAFGEVLKEIKIGMTEKEIAAKLDYLMKKSGAIGQAFETIVLSGKNTSLPHGVPTNKKIESGDFVLIDMGANFEGYCSDMTRTFAVKSASQEQKKVYDIVLRAQEKALSLLKSKLKAKDIDKAARDIIEKTEYKGKFGHALGHGVGLDIHESPTLSIKSDQILKEDMVVTLEPGIYIENKFGVRIEDMVLVKKDGYQNFTKVPKELLII